MARPVASDFVECAVIGLLQRIRPRAQAPAIAFKFKFVGCMQCPRALCNQCQPPPLMRGLADHLCREVTTSGEGPERG